jgi:hypothetical protein
MGWSNLSDVVKFASVRLPIVSYLSAHQLCREACVVLVSWTLLKPPLDYFQQETKKSDLK